MNIVAKLKKLEEEKKKADRKAYAKEYFGKAKNKIKNKERSRKFYYDKHGKEVPKSVRSYKHKDKGNQFELPLGD